jgi:zinc D-Ala-D-Ala carboxypeptidase
MTYRVRPPAYGRSSLLSQRPRQKHTARRIIGSFTLLLLIAASVYGLLQFTKSDADSTSYTRSAARTTPTDSSATPAGFDKTAGSTTDPSSSWVIVNKQHPLNPKTYQPNDLIVPNVPLRKNISSDERLLRTEPAKALEKLVADAAATGIHLNLQSGYRSYAFQAALYSGYVKQQGQTAADRTSARPGYSEHQTGMAADLGGTSRPACDVEKCYAQTPEGIWLAANAYKYGFIIRYTESKESVTGYDYEPWHIRYIGTELSSEMHERHVETLEEFFTVTGGTKY